MSRQHTRKIFLGLAVGVVMYGVLPPTAAWGHVNAESNPAPSGHTRIAFSFTHGCGESPTTALRIQIPPNATDVKPEEAPGWVSNVTDSEFGWNGGPAVNEKKTTFVATMKLSGKAGDTVYFPTIQGCAVGENPWIDKTPNAGAENAAPRVTLDATAVDAAAPGTGSTAKGTTTSDRPTARTDNPTERTGTTNTPASSNSEGSNLPLVVGGVLVALVVLSVGGYALSRRRRSSS